jgi:hypothetical protein
VLTGFNTDVEHDGVVYHVQTEDKGLGTPLILSLVYSGGAILASKRSPYQDLIDAGFDEAVLAERLKRQHRLICAAIAAGRVEELKQMGARNAGEQPAAEILPEPSAPEPSEQEPSEQEPSEQEPSAPEPEMFEIVSNAADSPPPLAPPPVEKVEQEDVGADVEDKPVREFELGRSAEPTPYVVFDSRREASFEADEVEEGLCVRFLKEQEFRSGGSLNLEFLVTNKTPRAEKPVSGASISFKVLGTSFRPVIVSVKTGKDGTAKVKTAIPKFASGRAAILVRAVKGGESVEIRRVVYPG